MELILRLHEKFIDQLKVETEENIRLITNLDSLVHDLCFDWHAMRARITELESSNARWQVRHDDWKTDLATLQDEIGRLRRVYVATAHCRNAKTCCDLGYHTKAQQDDIAQTHYFVGCVGQTLPRADWCEPCCETMRFVSEIQLKSIANAEAAMANDPDLGSEIE